MVLTEFYPTVNTTIPFTAISNPYYKLIIDAKDWNATWNDNRGVSKNLPVYHEELQNFTRSTTCTTNTWQGGNYIGLPSNSSSSYVDLSKDINFPGDSLYRIEIRLRRDAKATSINVFIDNTKIGDDSYSTYSKYSHWSRIILPVVNLENGNHNVKIRAYKGTVVGEIFIYKIRRWTGSSDFNSRSDNNIDIQSVEWTQNNVTETNTIKIEGIWKDDYLQTRNPNSMLQFDLADHLTFIVGNNKEDAKPMFGGYCVAPRPADDKIEINGIDRLMDLNRVPVYHNFNIGTVSTDDKTNTLPFIQFPTVFEIGRYLGETAEYRLKTYGVPYDYGFYKSFASEEEFNEVDTVLYEKEWDLNMGYPHPCLKLKPGITTGTATATIYEDYYTLYDANEYNLLMFDYYTSGGSAVKPLPVNIGVEMYKADEDISLAENWYIYFTGNSGYSSSDVLGSYTPKYSGGWERFSVDLKALFGAKSGASSGHYYISRVFLSSPLTSSNITNRNSTAIWIDNFCAAKGINASPRYVSQEVKKPLEELRQLCEQTNHIAFIRPGLERRDDILVMMNTEQNETTATIGPSNILSVGNWEYDPLNQEMCNQKHISFNFKNGKAGSTFYEDKTSRVLYGPFQEHTFEDGVVTSNDAYNLARNFVELNKFGKINLQLVLDGNTLIEPQDYILTHVAGKRLKRYAQIKSITQKIDINSEQPFTSTVDLNAPSDRFYNFIKRIRNKLANTNTGLMDSFYLNYSNSNLSKSAQGVYRRLY